MVPLGRRWWTNCAASLARPAMVEEWVVDSRPCEGEVAKRRVACRVLIGLLSVAFAGACVSLSSPHQRFINWVDGQVAAKNTIDELGFDPNFRAAVILPMNAISFLLRKAGWPRKFTTRSQREERHDCHSIDR